MLTSIRALRKVHYSRASHDAANFLDTSAARRINAAECDIRTLRRLGQIFLRFETGRVTGKHPLRVHDAELERYTARPFDFFRSAFTAEHQAAAVSRCCRL